MTAILALLKRLPVQVWLGAAAAIALGGTFAWGYSRGTGAAKAAAEQVMAAHLHADSSNERIVGALYKAKADSLVAQLVLNADLRADERVARASVRTVHDTVLMPGQIIRDTLHAVTGASAGQIDHLGATCDLLARSDSTTSMLASRTETACDARHTADSSLIADLSARVRLASAPVPRLSIEAGLGYDVLLGRPLVSGETKLRLFGPVSAAVSVDLVRGLAQPVEARGRILWQFR